MLRRLQSLTDSTANRITRVNAVNKKKANKVRKLADEVITQAWIRMLRKFHQLVKFWDM